MIEYARMDTHYLLYVYDRLKCDLWELGMNTDRLIRSAIGQSTQICRKVLFQFGSKPKT
jgi:exosome complex exonuclease RRP6